MEKTQEHHAQVQTPYNELYHYVYLKDTNKNILTKKICLHLFKNYSKLIIINSLKKAKVPLNT